MEFKKEINGQLVTFTFKNFGINGNMLADIQTKSKKHTDVEVRLEKRFSQKTLVIGLGNHQGIRIGKEKVYEIQTTADELVLLDPYFTAKKECFDTYWNGKKPQDVWIQYTLSKNKNKMKYSIKLLDIEGFEFPEKHIEKENFKELIGCSFLYGYDAYAYTMALAQTFPMSTANHFTHKEDHSIYKFIIDYVIFIEKFNSINNNFLKIKIEEYNQYLEDKIKEIESKMNKAMESIKEDVENRNKSINEELQKINGSKT